MHPDTSADQARAQAQADLARSRLDIQRWLAAEAVPPGAASPNQSAPDGMAGLVGIAIAALTEGFMRRPAQAPPLRLADVAGDTAIALLRPLAVRHPWALVGGAALAGAALAAAQPWRGLMQPALLGSVLTRLALRAIAARDG